MKFSCYKTLAAKYKTSISKIMDKYRDGKGGWGIPYETKSGKKRCYFANYADCKGGADASDIIKDVVKKRF